MRIALAVAVLSYGWSSLAQAPPAGWNPLSEPTPLRLVRDDYYPVSFVEKVKAGQFDPSAYWYEPPVGLHFHGKGQVQRDLGSTPEECTFTAVPRLARYDVHVTCGTGSRDASWAWIAHSRAVTDLASRDWSRPVEVVRWEGSLDGLIKDYQRTTAPRILKPMLGKYKAVKAKGSLEIVASGSVKLDKHLYKSTILPCAEAGDSEHRTCLLLNQETEPHALRLEADGTVVDGRIPRLMSGYLKFESYSERRTFHRER